MGIEKHEQVRGAVTSILVVDAGGLSGLRRPGDARLADELDRLRAFEFMGGTTELLIPDNLRSAVSRANRYEPDTNPTYHDLACHYAVAV